MGLETQPEGQGQRRREAPAKGQPSREERRPLKVRGFSERGPEPADFQALLQGY